MDLISFYWQPEDRKIKPVPYPAFNTLLNTLDVVRYPGDFYLGVSGDKRIVFLSFLSGLLPKQVICLEGSNLYGFDEVMTILKHLIVAVEHVQSSLVSLRTDNIL
jgi:hypothetical protein